MARTFIKYAAMVLFFSPPAYAQNVDITPDRVIMGQDQRGTSVTITNKTSTSLNLRIDWTEFDMSDAGDLDVLAEGASTSNSAAGFLRIVPRRIQLPAGGRQVVKLVRRNRGEISQELRSHLRVVALNETRLDDKGDADPGLKLDFRFGRTIPVFVRTPESNAQIMLTGASLISHQGQKKLRVQIRREGNQSVYGNLHILDGTGVDSPILLSRRKLAIYYPLAAISTEISLDNATATAIANGWVSLRFDDREFSPGGTLGFSRLPVNEDGTGVP